MRHRLAVVGVLFSLAVGCPPLLRTARAQAPAAALAPDTSWVARCAIYEVNVRDLWGARSLRAL